MSTKTDENKDRIDAEINEQESPENMIETENTGEKNPESPGNSDAKNDKEQDPLTELQAKYDSLNDKYLRLYSEFENFRRRTAREKLDLMSHAGSEMIKDLLPVVDDFDRAISLNQNSEDPAAIKEGFQLIHHKLLRILEQKGLKPMDSIGQAFDTEFHEAITKIPAPTEDLKGKVVDVAEKGYFYNNAIIRYAKVIVGE
jgi:molecular chaperone GrpE